MSNQTTPHEVRRKTPEEIRDHVYRKDFVFELIAHAWKPVAEHRSFAVSLYEKKYLQRYGAPMHEVIFEKNLAYMAALRNKLGRSIQPLGVMDDLAPVIAAIRLQGCQRESAAVFLAQAVLEALRNGDKKFMGRVKKISKATLGDHRNYQIWVAIGEVLESGQFAPSEPLGRALQDVGIVTESKYYPTTQEVKEYAIARRTSGAMGFGNLPADHDVTGWSRLWKSSGADAFLTPLRVGRPAKG